ncbi:MAG: ferritin family protein [Sedimentisphaerales bacterium]|nr:ferritin family protein [Sedimentisphaerales bacterium]
MDTELSAFDVLEIAERIERNGAKFYRRAAGLMDDADLSTLFINLAQWEMRHVEIFRQMKERLSDSRWDKGELTPLRIDSRASSVMAGLAVFGMHPDPREELDARRTKADMLRMAVGKETDSIVYYLGLKDFVSNAADKQVIDEVIAEEKKHVRILMQSLEHAA